MREPFDSQAYYHVYNRGVDKRVLFLGENDYQRFCESLYLFNDANHKHKGGFEVHRQLLLAGHEVLQMDQDPLVSVVSYCLVPNHFHMLLRARKPGGISKYLQSVGAGYAKYFNKKYERKGRLFENPFQADPIDLNEHLQVLPRYVHLNALDGTGIQWRGGFETDWERARARLDSFPWSSHGAYAGRSQFLPIVDESIVRAWFPTPEDYWKYLMIPTNMTDEALTFTRFM